MNKNISQHSKVQHEQTSKKSVAQNIQHHTKKIAKNVSPMSILCIIEKRTATTAVVYN